MSGVWLFLRRAFWIALSVLLIWFAVSNRQDVSLSLAPFATLVEAPLYLVFFLGILIGLILAASVTGWLRLQSFSKRRKAERRAEFLSGQVEELHERTHKAEAERAHTTASEKDN